MTSDSMAIHLVSSVFGLNENFSNSPTLSTPVRLSLSICYCDRRMYARIRLRNASVCRPVEV